MGGERGGIEAEVEELIENQRESNSEEEKERNGEERRMVERRMQAKEKGGKGKEVERSMGGGRGSIGDCAREERRKRGRS